MAQEEKPYIKEHDNKTTCFADSLQQATNALLRNGLTETENKKLDGANLMLFGVESWNKKDLKAFEDAMQATTNKFNNIAIFSCEMTEEEQVRFGEVLQPENLLHVKHFDLDNTVLEPKGARAIITKLAEVPTIEILGLQGVIEGKLEVSAAIADSLVTESNIFKTLYKVDLKLNQLNPDCAQHIARIIINLQALSHENSCEVDLFYNDIAAAGATHICKALKDVNSVVTHLDICCNQIGNQGAESIADMLAVNKTIKSLKVALNNIGNRGGIAIFKALPNNQTLESLDMSANVMKEEVGSSQSKPLANSLSGVYTDKEANLKEFDFTGIEFGRASWEVVAESLAATSNKIVDNPMTIRFSIVDLMNETNLKIMEGAIWSNNRQKRQEFSHIDWRRDTD